MQRINIIKKLIFVVLMTVIIIHIQKINTFAENESAQELGITYKTHIQDIGWRSSKNNGETAGTSGQSKRLEAINIELTNNDEKVKIDYQVHIQDIGWQEWKSDGELAGTEGQSKRLEAIKINLENTDKYSVMYRVHIQDIGWQEWKSDGELAGTEGQSKRLEAIKINLENTDKYSVMYRVHIQDIGWQEWKSDGELAGTEGQSKRLEAIEIKIVKKETKSKLYMDTPINNSVYYPAKTSTITVKGWKMANISNTYIKAYVDNNPINSFSINYYDRKDVTGSVKGYGTAMQNPEAGYKFDIEISKLASGRHVLKIESCYEDIVITSITSSFVIDTNIHIEYSTHIQDIGWQNKVKDGENSGTTGQSKRIEALKIQLAGVPETVQIKYRAHVQDIGWQSWKKNGELAGTEGKSKRIEAMQIEIEGLKGYTVEYRVHIQDIGWQSWASNGMTVGTIGQSKRIEAIQIRIVRDENTVVPSVEYSAHISNIGWTTGVYKNGITLGNENSKEKIEALKISLSNAENNNKINYSAYVQGSGWQNYLHGGEMAGTTGKGLGIEALKIKLDNLEDYCIEYRVYLIGEGWQDWKHNNQISGKTGEGAQISAIQIRLNIKTFKDDKIEIDTSRYPGYKERIENLISEHPNWKFKLLYTGLKFSDAVYGEYSNHSANLVQNTGSEWICSVCGSRLYDTGWYGASDKGIAYYMDPRNFLNENNIFQFLDVNKFEATSITLNQIQSIVNGTFLASYSNDIYTACKNQNVNPYYVIARLIQENGRSGSTTSRGMNGGDGHTYYNPFNIGASGNTTSEVLANALARAKSYGWNTMEKALEGGITFLKSNWLENYQNTLYQNKFDIDSTNGSALYAHQYMQNLSAAYSEALSLRGYYANSNKLESEFTFIIPMYEGMSSTLSQKPADGASSEEYPMNVVVNTTSGALALRSGASTSSSVITYIDKGTVLLSIQRGINSTWQKVVTKDGRVGYMSGEYLKQINDEIVCNYKAYIKTAYSGGLNVRTGPSTVEGFSKVDYLPDYTNVTVIDDSTYKGYEGSDWVQWSRIILSDGRQAFVPSSYVKR